MSVHMQLKVFLVAVFCLVVSPAIAQEPPETEQLKALRQDVEDLRQDMRLLKELMDKRGSEGAKLSAVSIRLSYPDGTPVTSGQVRLSMTRQNEKTIVATGETDQTGLALHRRLPYGTYQLVVQSDGWAETFTKLEVEFGADFELNVIAPARLKAAQLIFEPGLDLPHVEKLIFGERRSQYSGSTYSISSTPELGTESPAFKTFPVLGNGINDVALELEIELTRKVKQKDGTIAVWHWHGNDWKLVTPVPSLLPRKLLVSSKHIFAIQDSASLQHVAMENNVYFEAGNSESESRPNFEVSFEHVTDREQLDRLELTIPPGEIELEVEKIYGLTEGVVARTLLSDHPGRTKAGMILLETRFQQKSIWPNTLFPEAAWNKTYSSRRLVSRKYELAPGQTLPIRFTTE